MKPIAWVLGIDLAMAIFLLLSCTWLTVPVVETSVKIAARHLVRAGMEKYPVNFKVLAMISLGACQETEDRDKAVQGAFQEIAATILDDLEDPLLKADFMDIVDLLGVSLSPMFKIQGLSPEVQKTLNEIVCEFGKGVRL